MNPTAARSRQIRAILRRHSLGFLVGVIGAGSLVPFHHGLLGHRRRDRSYATPEHLRLVLEELGPAFVKLGQILSTRGDLLPPDFIAELAKLQDAGPPVDIDEIRQTIHAELGTEPEMLFEWFDPEPLASASIGQAHAATLRDGTSVVVKVRRPGVVAQVEEDLEILQSLAARAAQSWDFARDYDLPGIAAEFAVSLRAELDYLQEGRNAERIGANLAADDGVVVPRVFWEMTTKSVITLERMTGIKVNDLVALDAAGIDRRQLARDGASLMLKMIFDDHFFHADPHPGNLFIQADGTIALIDFGMVGSVDDERQAELADFLIAFSRGDPDALANALLQLSVTRESVDRDGLRVSLVSFVAGYRDRTLGQIDFGQLFTQLPTLLREHHLQLPREMALLFKVLTMAEGMAKDLDPTSELGRLLEPFSQHLIEERFSVHAMAKRFAQASADLGELVVKLPQGLRRMIEVLDTTGLEVHLRAAELEPLVGRVERIGNRLVAGLVAAALVNGIGGLVATNRKWQPREGPIIGVSLGIIGALTGYILVSARRPVRGRWMRLLTRRRGRGA
jgi:ubiquinone biosynthesis protein